LLQKQQLAQISHSVETQSFPLHFLKYSLHHNDLFLAYLRAFMRHGVNSCKLHFSGCTSWSGV